MIPYRFLLLEEVASTNDEVKRALEAGEPEGLVVRARRQAAGYGRQGRAWTSPEGGLYCSLLLRPQVALVELPTLSLVVGLAVRRALAGLVSAEDAARILVKWPNDVVLCDPPSCHPERAQAPSCHPERRPKAGVEGSRAVPTGRLTADAARDPSTPLPAVASLRMTTGGSPEKLCGVSLEGHAGGVCVGVGVNVRPPAVRPDVGGKNRAAYLADFADVSADDVLDALLAALALLYGEWMRAGFAPLVGEINAHASLTGRDVRMVDREGAPFAAGTVERVDAAGRLVLRDASGAEVPVASGEAHLA